MDKGVVGHHLDPKRAVAWLLERQGRCFQVVPDEPGHARSNLCVCAPFPDYIEPRILVHRQIGRA